MATVRRVARLVLAVVVAMGFAGCSTPPTDTPVTSTGPEATPTPVDVSAACADPGSCLVLLGTLVDGTGAAAVPAGALVIRGDRILAAGPREELSIPVTAQVIELGDATILPGLINAHVHNAYDQHNLQLWAQEGVTTVRDLGQRLGFPCFSSRERLREDPQNAWLVAAGPLVTVPGGYPIAGNHFPSLTVTSPEDARVKIRGLVDDGADVIKITMSSGGIPSLSAAEAAAIVETAHEHGVPVSAHISTAREAQRALDAGVDDLAHLAIDPVSDELIEQMVRSGVSWVPTLEAMGGRGADNLRRFVAAGGTVALGNDGGFLPGLDIGMPLNEIRAMHGAGLTPMQIIVAATRDAARVCRLDAVLGTLQPGKIADVLVVDGDPLQNLQALADVRMVIHRGQIIRDDGAAPFAAVRELQVQAADVSLHVRLAGNPDSGCVLIAINGGPGLTSNYMWDMERLAGPDCAVLTYDQRGLGKSTLPWNPDSRTERGTEYQPRTERGTEYQSPASYTLEKYAEDVEAIRQAVGAERVHLMGHSWGGIVAMEYAILYPERVASLIFFGGGPPTWKDIEIAALSFSERVERLTQSGVIAPRSEWASDGSDPTLPANFSDPAFTFAEDLLGGPPEFSQVVSNLTYANLVGMDLRGELALVQKPVLVMFGRDDPFGLPMAEATRDALVGAQVEFVVIERCGHFWHECPGQFYPRVQWFLGQVAGKEG